MTQTQVHFVPHLLEHIVPPKNLEKKQTATAKKFPASDGPFSKIPAKDTIPGNFWNAFFSCCTAARLAHSIWMRCLEFGEFYRKFQKQFSRFFSWLWRRRTGWGRGKFAKLIVFRPPVTSACVHVFWKFKRIPRDGSLSLQFPTLEGVRRRELGSFLREFFYFLFNLAFFVVARKFSDRYEFAWIFPPSLLVGSISQRRKPRWLPPIPIWFATSQGLFWYQEICVCVIATQKRDESKYPETKITPSTSCLLFSVHTASPGVWAIFTDIPHH